MSRSCIVLMILGMAAASGARVAIACFADEPPEMVLKNHGLSIKRGGSTYVLAAESEIQVKLNEAQRIHKQLRSMLKEQHQYHQAAEERRRFVPALLEERIMISQQLRSFNRQNVVIYNQFVGRLNEINDQLRLLDAMGGDPRQKQDLENRVAQQRGRYIQAILELRERVDATNRRYAELAEDETIKAAFLALRSSSKSAVKLGPSRGFDDSVKQLVSREKFVLSKEVEMRRKGGVFEVDVTLNEKVTTPMIFDTGASFVALSAEFAARIGLDPQPNDPTIQLHDASGGVTAAKLMTIATVRVGPFTAKNVDCVVLPPDKRNVPLLLGQSFINLFTHKIENGRLLLSKVDTNDAAASSSSPAKRPSRGKRSTKVSTGTQAPAAGSTTTPDRPY